MCNFVASSNSHNKYSHILLMHLCLRFFVTCYKRVVFLLLVITCTGCFGVAFDGTTTETIENPIPLKASLVTASSVQRWACQPGSYYTPLTKSDFVLSWGEPGTKEVFGERETWRYAESGRWCGVWVSFFVAIPLMLPVCETYDEITFESDLAVSATSRRFVFSAIGFSLVAGPYFDKAGVATDNGPGNHQGRPPTYCSWRPPEAQQPPMPDTVNCFSGGKRQWVERSLCD